MNYANYFACVVFLITLISASLVFVATTSFASPAKTATGYLVQSAALRVGPATSFPAIARVRNGRSLKIHGCVKGWKWCEVSVEAKRGWLPAEVMRATYRHQDVPLYVAVPNHYLPASSSRLALN